MAIKKEYILTDKMVLLNFSEKYCKSETELLRSKCFEEIWSGFVKKCIKTKKQDAIELFNLVKDPVNDFITLFKLILTFKISEIHKINKQFNLVLEQREKINDLIENFYNHWRLIERYSIMFTKYASKGVDSNSFMQSASEFNSLVLKTYRSIREKAIGESFAIYRQLPAGVNAAILINKNPWMHKDSKYYFLKDTNFIQSVIIRPPFISYTAKNKRTGVYPEATSHPYTDLKYDSDDYFCYPAYVGNALTYIYFHRDYLSHGISICNLFQFVKSKDCEGKKPDIIYIFGAKTDKESAFYYDDKEDIYVGIAPHSPSIDYFGYMKKMLLTLYNVKMINSGALPIHGACVNITLNNGVQKNVVIIGDSGAGKSESLEALSEMAGDNISNMLTVFDDMGTFKIENGHVVAYGTEIGAFVRLDDMTSGYAYKEMDRAIFLNPDKMNSRLVIPVATHAQIMKGYKVDMCFYANNFDELSDEITYFDSKKDALDTFIRGARKAKGTTGEIGMTESFFANPFGPVQKEVQTRVILDEVFDALFKDEVIVGELHTKLAVPGLEQTGPAKAAKKLFELIEK